MADSQEPRADNQAKQPDAAAAGNAPSGNGPAEGGEFRNPRHSGHKRSRMGKNQKKHERGRAEFEKDRAADYHDRKRRKVNKDGEEEAPKPNPFFTEEEIAAEGKRPKRKVAVMIGYSGTGYRGMQINGDEPTIERDLFRAFIRAGAISKANANDPRKSSLVRCARTDKGVHAAGNVISLKLIIDDPAKPEGDAAAAPAEGEEGADQDYSALIERINSHLPGQIRVWGIQRTNNSFSCYQVCDSRWYEYLMPSYCLLPPHPSTYLGRMVPELAKKHGYAETLDQLDADVAGFWERVEAEDIKPLLDGLDPALRAQVLERVHHEDNSNKEDQPKEQSKEEQSKDEQSKEEQPQQEQPQQEAKEDAPAEAEHAGAPLSTVQPKKGQLGPLDFALRDLKAAYVGAKRRYRVSPERLARLQAVLSRYEGTHNFHNYTVQKAFADPSAKRHIKSFVVNPEPVIIGDTEWLSLKVHGQSFMMHQIRKMVGLASLMVRCGTPVDRVEHSYQRQKMAIPKAPGLGLLLERPVFDQFNRRATETLGRESIDFAKYEDKLLQFKQEHIYNRIFEAEERENAFHSFFNQIDQFKQNHFLWTTAGGMEAAVLTHGKDQQNVDKQLGDDDEDPEGGEG